MDYENKIKDLLSIANEYLQISKTYKKGITYKGKGFSNEVLAVLFDAHEML